MYAACECSNVVVSDSSALWYAVGIMRVSDGLRRIQAGVRHENRSPTPCYSLLAREKLLNRFWVSRRIPSPAESAASS